MNRTKFRHFDFEDEELEELEALPLEEQRKMVDGLIQQFLASDKFEKACQDKFREMQYAKMVQKKTFTLVDCLEEAMDLWHFGKNWFDVPTHNLYIPVKTTLMMKPKLT